MKLVAEIAQRADEHAALRRDLHAHPELGLDEDGEADNVVPDHCTLQGTVRTFSVPALDIIEPRMLHKPSYDFNDRLIPLGATYWVRLTEAWLAAAP